MNFPIEYEVPWSGRGMQYTDEEIARVVEVMKSADGLTQGKHQAEFESRLTAYLGGGKAFAVATGTSALELAAVLCELKPGDEVILPAHTFAATAIPFARTGAKLVWADIDPETFVVTADTIAPHITERTKVVIVVHLYGLLADMEPITQLTEAHGLRLVEDCAQAIGARADGRMAGTFGDFGCFSFHSHKNITTLGEGGALWVKDPALQKLVPGIRHNGMRAYEEPRDRYWIPAMTNVDLDLDGVWPYNFCIGEVQCALGAKLLDRLDQINADRRARFIRIREALSDCPELQFQRVDDERESAFYLLPAQYNHSTATRDDLIELLALEYRVKCVVQYYPLYRYPMFQRAGFGEANCPNSDTFFDNMLSFPFQHWMSDEQESYLIQSVRGAVSSFRS